MIPRICANCGCGRNVADGNQVLGTVCKATPWALWKDPGDMCLQFEMDDNPVYVVPDKGEEDAEEQ